MKIAHLPAALVDWFASRVWNLAWYMGRWGFHAEEYRMDLFARRAWLLSIRLREGREAARIVQSRLRKL